MVDTFFFLMRPTCNQYFSSGSDEFMNVNGHMLSTVLFPHLGHSPVFSLKFKANHMLGPGYTDDKNAL